MIRTALAAQCSALALLSASAVMTRNAPAGIDPQERRQPQVGGRGQRAAAFAPDSYDAEARTVEAVLSAGSPVRRYYFTEELEISESAVDLGRVERGLCSLLDAHNQYSVSGIGGTVTNVRIENAELVGTFTFADTEFGRMIEGMVARGELRGVSIGYRVTKWEITRTEDDGHETWRATAWELLEASLVPVPADPNAGVRSASGTAIPGTTQEEDDMRRNLPGGAAAAALASTSLTPPAAAVDASRAAPVAEPTAPAGGVTVTRFGATDAVDFMDQARSFGVETRARELVDQNSRGEIGTEAARSAIMQAAAEAQRSATGGVRATPGFGANGRQEEGSRNAIADALVARTLREQPNDAAREFMGMRLLEIAASRAGLSPRERDPITILRAAHTSSDFPLLMEGAGNRVLLARYNAAEPTYRDLAARRDLTDFKATNLLRIGDFPTLLPYEEDGEIKAGTIGEGKETVILGSYGRILRLSRQAIVNDDLGAFDQVFGSIGRMIARFENNTFYAMKAQNGEQISRQNEGPADAYLRTLNRSTSAINEDVQSGAVDALKGLNTGLTDALMGTAKLGDAFENMGKRIIASLIDIAIQQAIIKPIANSLFGAADASGNRSGGSFSAITGLLSRTFGGGKATGGAIDPSNWYVVGEKGPELFAPGVSGTVIPNGGRGSRPSGGGIASIVPSPYFDAVVDGRVVRGSMPVAQATMASGMAEAGRASSWRARQTLG